MKELAPRQNGAAMQVQTALSAAHFPLKSWIGIAKAWCAQAIRPHNSYRPEKHYMRGPGPKWRAKHAPHGVTTEWPEFYRPGRIAQFYSSGKLIGFIPKRFLVSRRQQPLHSLEA